ncbi:hypothetical protein LZ198_13115 [Myxococcus sp. K15C18031901]|uniref:hypothetical protein n=1 Tax=Myxococcus dinghuensis TaxID=2906761 RepID=UPI0020A80932|nr:hypothetical protein [Myxococcus dinghuensis]MCP3099808.1 hypothetical protein [Myxococcus dinghuensis]
MHLERWWFRTVVCATALGWLGLGVGCSSKSDAPDDDTECRNGCPEQETPPPDEEVPPPSGETPDAGTSPPPLEPRPPPPPPTSGSTLWLTREGSAQDDLALGAAVDANGDILTVAVHELDDLQEREPTDNTVRLVLSRHSEAGEPTWTRGYAVRVAETPEALFANVQARVAPAPDGGCFLAVAADGVVDFEPQELGNGAFLARLDAAGNLVWASPVNGEGITVMDLAVDAQGRPVVALNSAGWSVLGEGVEGDGAMVVRYSPEGKAERAVPIGRADGRDSRVDVTTIALDGQGRLVVGGRYVGAARFGNQRFTSEEDGSPFLAVYQDSGALAWVHALHQASGTLKDVGVDAQGTVVALGSFLGTVSWGQKRLEGHVYRASPFLVSADKNGRERWSRNLGDGLLAGALAVEPDGRLVVAGFTYSLIVDGESGPDGLGSAQPVALRYGADGASVGLRLYLSDPPRARGELYGVEDIPFVGLLANGDAVLFGHTDRTSDFGTGRQTPARSDIFLLRMMR